MKYTTIIFDLDGTLLDTSEGIMAGASYTTNVIGLPELTFDQQRSFIGPPVIDSFMRECGMSQSNAKEAVEIYRQRYKEKGLYQAKHYFGMKELLDKIKELGYKTAVATLKREDFAKDILKHFELDQYFDFIRGIDNQDTHNKSDIITLCLNDLEQTDKTKVLLVGDSIFDAVGAEKTGIDFIAVTYGYGFKDRVDASKSKNIFIAENVEDLMRYLIL